MYKIVVFISLYFACSLGSFSQQDFSPVADEKALRERLSSMSGDLHSIKSDFIQEKYMQFLDMRVVSKGKFWFKKENSLRWEYTEPFSYVVIIKDGNLLIQDDGKSNEMKMRGNRVFQHVNQIIVASVKGEILDTKDFDVDLLENTNEIFVKLATKNPDIANVITEMHMFFDKANFSVVRIKMVEPNGDHTVIRFENRKLNEPIPASVFTL